MLLHLIQIDIYLGDNNDFTPILNAKDKDFLTQRRMAVRRKSQAMTGQAVILEAKV